MKLLNLFRPARHRRGALSSAEIDSTIAQALMHLRHMSEDNHQMRRALHIACAEGDAEDLICAYCEDYCLDPIDEVRRIDVLKHALKRVNRG